MGYPSQPQDPYGQHPQQPYGSGPQYPPQQPYGSGSQQQPQQYGYQPPTPPPPKRSNVGLIVLLAVGIPLLLLGGCAAVVFVLGDASRDTVIEAGSPVARQPSKASEQPATKQEPAPVGQGHTLQGMDAGLKVAVTLEKYFNPATPAEDYMKPKPGTKLVAVQVTLSNVGQAVYSGAPDNGAYVIDDQGQQYQSTFSRIQEGQGFNGLATINVGDVRKGVIVFAVPEAAKLVKFQYALDSGFADQKGEWTLS